MCRSVTGERPPLIKQQRPPARQPTDAPPFTIGQLRKAVPPHCFKRSLPRSLSYLFGDLLMVCALVWASSLIDAAPVPAWLRWGALWPAYWWLQGAVATGVWVIAHECGHQAFSDSQTVNDAVGLALHTALLVPYYSWKHSHRRHHSNTCSVARDEVFVPEARERPHDGLEFEQLLPVRIFRLTMTLTVGWPLYLLMNVASRPYSRAWVSHFDPWSPIFSRRERVEVAVSDAALVAWSYCLYLAAGAYGWPWLAKTYFAPYLVVNFWLVVITLLQHTHRKLPHFSDEAWDWLRGALATVDRSYGPLLNTLHHHIADTHVAHHLFSQMPHYHAEEATAALRPLLGEYYVEDHTPVMKALWREWYECRYAAPDEPGSGVLWMRE